MASGGGKAVRPRWKRHRGVSYGQQEDVNPKDFIRIRPLSSDDDHDAEGVQVTARTSTIRMDSRSIRDIISHENYLRRKKQMAELGLKSSNTDRYGELGTVEMDTKKLIAKTLGQMDNLRGESSSESSDDDDNMSGYSSSSSIGLKAPEEADMSRLKLGEQLKSSDKRLGSVKLGNCLFSLVRSEEQERLRQRQETALEESRRVRDSMRLGGRDTGAGAGSRFDGSLTGLGLGSRAPSAMSRASPAHGRPCGTSSPGSSNLERRQSQAPSAYQSEPFTSRQRSPDGSSQSLAEGYRSKTEPPSEESSPRKRQGSSPNKAGSSASVDDDHSGPCNDSGADLDQSSSVQLDAFSRSTIDSMEDEQDDQIDLPAVHRQLCAVRWILSGLLMENLSALPAVSDSWLPSTKHYEAKHHNANFHQRRVVEDEYDRLIRAPLATKSTETPGARRMRRARLSSSGGLTLAVPSLGSRRSAIVPSVQQAHPVGVMPPEYPVYQIGLTKRPGSGANTARVKHGSRDHKKLKKEEKDWLIEHVSQRRTGLNTLLAELRANPPDNHPPALHYIETPVPHDPKRVRKRFDTCKARRDLIVQTQLMSIEKERYKTCQQKFEALLKLESNGRIWSDLRRMRGSVKTETATMAKHKLMMNFKWYNDLILSLPEAVINDRLCAQVLRQLKDIYPIYVEQGPERLTKKKTFAVLSQLEVWERDLPEVVSAMNFVRKQVIFIPDKEFEAWLFRGRREYALNEATRFKEERAMRMGTVVGQEQQAAVDMINSTRMQ